MRFTSCVDKSTFDPSSAPDSSTPTPALPGVLVWGCPDVADGSQLLPVTGTSPCGLVKFTSAIVPMVWVAPFEYCATTLPLEPISRPANWPAAVPLLWMELTPNVRSDNTVPLKL